MDAERKDRLARFIRKQVSDFLTTEFVSEPYIHIGDLPGGFQINFLITNTKDEESFCVSVHEVQANSVLSWIQKHIKY